jgi:hypothetical protein
LRMDAMMGTEARFRAHYSRAGDALFEQQRKDLMAQIVALGTGVFVEMNRYLFCRTWDEHILHIPVGWQRIPLKSF